MTGPFLLPEHLDPAEPRYRTRFTVEVDGRRIDARGGQTVAAVLMAFGRTSWHTGETGRPRGLFCGVGECFGCLLSVNGVPDVRACRREARPGDVIRTEPGAP